MSIYILCARDLLYTSFDVYWYSIYAYKILASLSFFFMRYYKIKFKKYQTKRLKFSVENFIRWFHLTIISDEKINMKFVFRTSNYVYIVIIWLYKHWFQGDNQVFSFFSHIKEIFCDFKREYLTKEISDWAAV